MLCSLWEKLFNDSHWFYETKWDGERCVAFFERPKKKSGKSKVRLQSRVLKDFTFRYPEIVADLQKCLRARNAILDGEVVVLDEKGRSNFEILQHRIGLIREADIKREMSSHPVYYMVFDLLFLNGRPLFDQPLIRRRLLLQKILKKSRHVKISETFEYQVDGVALFEAARRLGLEGIVAKEKSSPYHQGERGRHWLKIKIFHQQECVIGGFTSGKGLRKDTFGALILGVYEKGKAKKRYDLVPVGSLGTGFDEKTLVEMKKKLLKLQTRKCPFLFAPKVHDRPHWVRPKLVAQIKFANWTSDGMMRVPVFLGLRFDKKPKDCLRETPIKQIK